MCSGYIHTDYGTIARGGQVEPNKAAICSNVSIYY
jgi:hypothetical protein